MSGNGFAKKYTPWVKSLDSIPQKLLAQNGKSGLGILRKLRIFTAMGDIAWRNFLNSVHHSTH